MYLHIGKDIMIKERDIMFIFDYASLKENQIFKQFIDKIQEKDIQDISKGNPKAIVITKENGIIRGYISNISSVTLGRRNTI